MSTDVDPAIAGAGDFLAFIVLGAQKAGTTALFEYLSSQDQFYLPAGKEVPFLSDPHYGAGPEQWHADYFQRADPQKFWGTVTPRYLGQSDAPERIARHFPSAHLFALVRAPWSRIVSHYSMMRRREVEDRTLSDALAASLDQSDLAGGEQDEYLNWTLYGAHLDRFRAATDQPLTVFLTTDLQSDPQTVVETVAQRIGAGPVATIVPGQFHVAGGNARFHQLATNTRDRSFLRALWHRIPAMRRAQLTYFLQVRLGSSTPAEIPEEALRLAPDVAERAHEVLAADAAKLENWVDLPADWLDDARPPVIGS